MWAVFADLHNFEIHIFTQLTPKTDANILLWAIRWNPIPFFLRSRLICLFVVGGRLLVYMHLWLLGPWPVIGLKTCGTGTEWRVPQVGSTQRFHLGVLIQMSAHTSSTTKRAGFIFSPPKCCWRLGQQLWESTVVTVRPSALWSRALADNRIEWSNFDLLFLQEESFRNRIFQAWNTTLYCANVEQSRQKREIWKCMKHST